MVEPEEAKDMDELVDALLERKKKFTKKEEPKGARAAGKGPGTVRDKYEEDSYRWCYRGSAPGKVVRVTVKRERGKFVKDKVQVNGEVTYG